MLKTALCLLGLAAIVYGFWLMYRPLGFIAGGMLLFILALIIDRIQEHNTRAARRGDEQI